jgi:hypothetical protein
MVMSDWYQAKVRFQAWLVKMRKIAANSTPNRSGRKAVRARTATGRKERIGTLCSTSKRGKKKISA